MQTHLKYLRECANQYLGIDTFNKSVPKKNIEFLIEELYLHQIELEIQNADLTTAQHQLEDQRKIYADVYELAPVGYFTLDTNGLITDVNEAGADLIGIRKLKLINRSFSCYVAPEYQLIFSEYRQRTLKHSNIEVCEIKLLTKKRAVFYARIKGKTIIDFATNDKKTLIIIFNITLAKQTDEKIHHHQLSISQVDRMSSAKELSSILAHELNYPLGVIANYINGCIRRLEKGSYKIDEILNVLKQASQQVNRTSEIILRMKNLFHKEKLNYQSTCLDSMIKEVISLLNYEIKNFPITIRYLYNKRIPKIMVDKLYIQQVILNLARNSIESMRDAETNDAKLTIEINQFNQNMVEICILDNGPGVGQDDAHHLFNIHFTTKPYGLGLGLAVSRTIVESHGGELFADVNFPYGACFKFTLPVSP